MNLEKFNEKVIKINNENFGFGNEVLYVMASDPSTLKDKRVLAGAMWLIGRSYAASPQRRHYGKTKKDDTYFKDKRRYKKNGNPIEPEKRPIWPVATSNDGREDFFMQIAGSLIKKSKTLKKLECEKNTRFEYELKNIFKNEMVNEQSKDFVALKTGIVLVLNFNKDLSEALETFDSVPVNKENGYGEYIRCSNHISFCSKFLHFYLPDTVYIIDNFAREGAKLLFKKGASKASFDDCRDDYFEKEIYDEICKNKYELLRDAIKNNIKKDTKLEDLRNYYNYEYRSEKNIENSDEDNSKADDYINHCVRSYLLGLYLKDKVDSINQVQIINKGNKIKPMSRLTDAIFLNIKRPYTEREKEYKDVLDELFYNKVKNKIK